MRYKIDPSSSTYLAICLDCGWRGGPLPTRLAALVETRRHERRAHPGDLDAYKALHRTRRHSEIADGPHPRSDT